MKRFAWPTTDTGRALNARKRVKDSSIFQTDHVSITVDHAVLFQFNKVAFYNSTPREKVDYIMTEERGV